MLVVVRLNNYDKKIEYIGRLVKYKYINAEEYKVTEWEDLFGTPYISSWGEMFCAQSTVQEDKEWIKDIFEHLIVGETWRWE